MFIEPAPITVRLWADPNEFAQPLGRLGSACNGDLNHGQGWVAFPEATAPKVSIA